MKRTLRLHRDVLAELGAAELGRVAGASREDSRVTCPEGECLPRLISLEIHTCASFLGGLTGCRPAEG